MTKNNKNEHMKPTEIKRSTLQLNKKTIANLSDAEMSKINGGIGN